MIKLPDKLKSQNPNEYGIVDAIEITGHKVVATLQDLIQVPDSILTFDSTGTAAVGQMWFVIEGSSIYRLVSWLYRKQTYGWQQIMKDGLWTPAVLDISQELGDSEGKLISLKKITEELQRLQDEKLDGSLLTNLTIGLKPRGVTTLANLPTTGDDIGAAYLVEDFDTVKYPYGVILAWTGTEWVNTGLTGFPSDVATKGGVNKTIKELDDEIKLRTKFITFYNVSLESGNFDFLEQRIARNTVPEILRTHGLIISYRLVTGEWITELFISTLIPQYLEDVNWEEIGKKVNGLLYKEDTNELWLTSDGALYGTPVELPKGKGLLNISNDTGNYAFESSQEARNEVTAKDRERGQVVTYQLKNGDWMLDMFIGDSIGSWSAEASWRTYATTNNILTLAAQIEELTTSVSIIEGKIDSKGDGLEIDEENYLYLTSNGERVGDPVLLPEGGGGSGQGIVMRVRIIGSSSVITGLGADIFIKYSFSSIDSETGDDTGPGTYTISVNNVPVSTGTAIQGENTFNIKNYINIGSNTVRVRVVDSYGNSRTVTWNVTSAALTISSTFADDNIYSTNPVLFRYTPIGIGEKTIRFILDGNELTPDVTDTSGRLLTKTLPTLGNGYHSLLVYAESNIEGSTLRSNELYYEFIFANAGATQPIISASFNQTEVPLFSVIEIPYMVYNPTNPISLVTIRVNGTVHSQLNAPRTRLLFTYSAYEQGALLIEFICGATIRVFNILVQASEYDITEELNDLLFKAQAVGKSNSSADRDSWNYGGFTSVFENFTWADDGWLKDANNYNCLRLIGDSKVSMNIRPFSNDILVTGMTLTIEYSTTNVTNMNAVVANCRLLDGIGVQLTPSSIILKSALSTLTARLDSSEKTSVTFIVQKLNESRLLYLFIDGIASGTLLYPASDNFTQSPQQDLVLSTGNRSCNSQFYTIRWYKNSLNFDLILGNYVYDIENLDDKMEVYARNLITNEYGNIDYNKALTFLPCMTFIGDLPTFKGDKKVCDIIYEDMQDSRNSFTAMRVYNDVQGTSSLYYPRKNFKFVFSYKISGVPLLAVITMTESGEVVNSYPLHGESVMIPAKAFCLKADFAESSGTHNTGIAVLMDEVLKKMNYKTPPQIGDVRIRTTVYGFPILLFHKSDVSTPSNFIGKYNFNTDKSAENTFGFGPGMECWEYLNNTSDRCLWKSADFTGTGWLNDFEGRYPDGNTDPLNLKKVYDWVTSCIGNSAKFKSECALHFNVNWLLFYYIMTEVIGMVDLRAKNMFITTYGERGSSGELIWYFIFYDNDTCLGINNEGLIAFNFNIEDLDIINSGHVWNGWDSELWKLVKAAYPAEIQTLYQSLRLQQYLSIDSILNILQDRLADKWCETVYNRDGYYKYIEPLLTDNNGAYLYALQGSRSKHRIWWTTNRLRYMDSKYNAGSHLSDTATMRLYTPSSWGGGVTPNFDFTMGITSPGYIRVKYGSYITDPKRTDTGDTVTITSPSATFNDTETIIYGISRVKSLGNLAPKYAGTVDITNATALEDLTIGSTITGYSNTNLTVLHTGANEKLRVINVANCPNLTQSLDLLKCFSIETIEARGSGITGVELPSSGVLKTMNLPATISSIYLKNLLLLNSLTIQGYSNINTIVIDNVPNINSYGFVKNCINTPNSRLSKIRLIGINATDTDSTVLNALALMTGEDDNGIPTSVAIVTGSIHIGLISLGALDRLRLTFPNLIITYTSILDVIDFQDNIVKSIMTPLYDTNGDGEISADEVSNAVLPSNILSNTGAKLFNEAYYWGGAGSVIDNCDTLESVSVLSGKTSKLFNLPALTQIKIYLSTSELISSMPSLTANTFSDCYNIDNWIITPGTRYKETLERGVLLGLVLTSLTFYRWILPLKGYTSLVIDEAISIDDAYESTYPHGRLITSLTLKKLYAGNIGRMQSLRNLVIKGVVPTGASLQIFGSNIKKLDIDGSNGSGSININLRTSVTPNTKYDYIKIGAGITGGDIWIPRGNGSNFVTVGLLDLGVDYGGSMSGSDWGVIDTCVIRNPNTLVTLSTSYWYTFLNIIYVPDALVDSYKAATNWIALASKIRPLSEYIE